MIVNCFRYYNISVKLVDFVPRGKMFNERKKGGERKFFFQRISHDDDVNFDHDKLKNNSRVPSHSRYFLLPRRKNP